MNHNELSGWAHPTDLIQHFTVLFLRSGADEQPRIAKRFSAMKEILMGKQATVTEIVAEGSTRLERLLSLVSLADWTSLYMALFAGIDPTTIPAIDLLKEKMK
jgi:glucose/mannose-6-phosphate isomerase